MTLYIKPPEYYDELLRVIDLVESALVEQGKLKMDELIEQIDATPNMVRTAAWRLIGQDKVQLTPDRYFEITRREKEQDGGRKDY